MNGTTTDKLIDKLARLAETIDQLDFVAVLCANQKIVNELAELGLKSLRVDAFDPSMMSHADAAKRLNRTTKTVLKWCRAGKFEGAHQVSERKWIIPKTEVERWA